MTPPCLVLPNLLRSWSLLLSSRQTPLILTTQLAICVSGRSSHTMSAQSKKNIKWVEVSLCRSRSEPPPPSVLPSKYLADHPSSGRASVASPPPSLSRHILLERWTFRSSGLPMLRTAPRGCYKFHTFEFPGRVVSAFRSSPSSQASSARPSP